MSDIPRADDDTKLAAIAVSLYPPAPRAELVSLMQAGMIGAELRPHLGSGKWRQAEDTLRRCEALSIQAVHITSEFYPDMLRQVPLPPPVLYVRSRSERWAPGQIALAVVGTRAASVEACAFASKISMEIASAGVSIVSGLALGIDGAAHRGALSIATQRAESDEPPTVAVLAHGLDTIYPPSHEPLAEQIVEQGGALVSEYAPGTTALKHHFLARNRIIAGMSQGVVVIQAGSRSGSLVTARFGADFGRDVFVYQHSGWDERHSGGAEMIEDGAMPFTGSAEILAEYGLAPQQKTQGVEELAIDEFLARNDLSPADLLKLELAELVERLPGNRVRVKAV